VESTGCPVAEMWMMENGRKIPGHPEMAQSVQLM